MANKVTLYNFYTSSASWRVRIALALKGVDYEYSSVNLKRDGGEQHSPEYKKLNPMSQVPALSVDGTVITQSMPIIEFLEETYPDPPLLPKNKVDRAKIRALCEIVNSGIQPLQNAFNKTGEVEKREENVRFYIAKGFEALERMLQSTAGRYSYGDDVTMADLFLVPQTYKAKRFNVDTSPFPTILRVYNELIKLPAFMAADPSRQPDTPEDQRAT